MKRIYNACLILCLAIGLNIFTAEALDADVVRSIQAGETAAPTLDLQETSNQLAASNSGSSSGCRTAFSLSEALGNAQQRTAYPDVVLPTSLPGSSDSQSVSADGALRGVAGLLQRITNGLTMIAAAVAVFFIVFNAGGLLLAAGDSEAIKKARNGVVWALLGLLLIMGAYIIAKTAISITYSGSDKTNGRNYFDMHCDEH